MLYVTNPFCPLVFLGKYVEVLWKRTDSANEEAPSPMAEDTKNAKLLADMRT